MEVGLARISTLDQDPQLQINALERAGCWPIYQERVSGKAGAAHPVRNEVLRQLDRGDTLTVWKLDRLGRSLVELQRIVTDLERRGIKFRSLTEHIDTSTTQGRLFFVLLAAFAEFKRALIIERTRAGKARRAAEGKHPGGRRRFGMEADHATIREDEACLLREAAERLRGGESMSSILDGWNDQGIPAYGGGRWEATVLRNMLASPRVVPIIGQDAYEAMVRLFRDAASRQKLGRPAQHLLSGILRCECGQPMYSVYTGKAQRAYRCRKSEGSGGRSQGCGKVNVSEPAADRWAAEAFIAAVASEEFTSKLNARRAELLEGETTAAKLDDWRAELGELEQVLDTRFAADVHRARHAELQRLVRQATTRLMQRSELQALYDLPKSEGKLRKRWADWTISERRVWLKRVLEYITAKPATSTGRGSDVAARLDPKWRISSSYSMGAADVDIDAVAAGEHLQTEPV
jgi:DNA invertase Pin-like site-specific DNA recombinase